MELSSGACITINLLWHEQRVTPSVTRAISRFSSVCIFPGMFEQLGLMQFGKGNDNLYGGLGGEFTYVTLQASSRRAC
jgi:hypothetical protein